MRPSLSLFRRSDALWEARIADLKEAHERERRDLLRTVDALAEQIEYLRVLLGRPNLKAPGLNPAEQLEADPDFPGHVSEEEEDLRALQEAGLLTERDLEEALARAGLRK